MKGDQDYMRYALTLAEQAVEQGEVPVGAVLVYQQQVIASSYNQSITHCDPSAHAEILVLRQGGKVLENYRLLETTLFVTLEPCMMCAMAMIHARIKRVVFAATDPKTGAAGSVVDTFKHPSHNHKVSCQGGVLAESCSELLRTFFQQRR